MKPWGPLSCWLSWSARGSWRSDWPAGRWRLRSWRLAFSEFVAAFGLVAVIKGKARHGVLTVALALGAYISAGYWFTASTSFANPAVTLSRAFTDTFTGIRLSDVPGFIVAQVLGAAAAAMLFRWFFGGVIRRQPT